MKRLLLLFVVFLLLTSLYAQENQDSPIDISFSGFLRTDAWYDSREQVEALEGLFMLYPKNEMLDFNGNDIHAHDNINLLAISTRLRTQITGPDILGAKTSLLIEGDFTGTSNTNSIRLRHANIKLDWERATFLMGRYWHPLFITSSFPTVMALNTGAPFNFFNRSPQIRFEYAISERWKATTAVVYQSDRKSAGPEGDKATYIRNSSVPDLNLQLHYAGKSVRAGLAANYKQLQPRTSVTGYLTDATLKTNEQMGSYIFMGYFGAKTDGLEIKASGIYGQNMYEHLMLGGYGVSSLDSITGYEEYSPYTHFSFWHNIIFGKKTKVGLFSGYIKNLGTDDPLVADPEKVYARGADIDFLMRLSPFVAHRFNHLMASAELDYTLAGYGRVDYADYAKVKDIERVRSFRVLMTLTYFF